MTELPPGHVHLWLVKDTAVIDPDLAARYAALLNTEEKIRWQRFIHAHDRQRFLLTRALARTVLAGYLDGADPASLNFTANMHGKPALADSTAINFNLSHTKGLLALAVTSAGDIGVDVEDITRRAATLELAARYFSAHENRELAALPAEHQRDHFFRIWTLKEAYVKARGLGLRIPLDSFSFSFANTLPGITFTDADFTDHQHWFFHCMSHDDFRIALAMKLSGQRVVQLQVYNGVPLEGFSSPGC
ncbi:MAG: 4'-phosphopantetheinyl transferase superfamily protein [Pseudomonadota bacterium]